MITSATKLALENHLNFDGNARAAFDVYRQIFGGELSLFTYGESPISDRYPEKADKIMHARLQLAGAALMGCDVPEGYESPRGFRISISLDEKSDADRVFNALADGGEICMPIMETFWSPWFGMVTDRFGIGWMVNVVPADSASHTG